MANASAKAPAPAPKRATLKGPGQPLKESAAPTSVVKGPPGPSPLRVLELLAEFQMITKSTIERVKEKSGKAGQTITQDELEVGYRLKQLDGDLETTLESFKTAYLFHKDKGQVFEPGAVGLSWCDNGKSQPQWKTEALALKKALCEAKGEVYDEAGFEAEVKTKYPFKSSPGFKYEYVVARITN